MSMRSTRACTAEMRENAERVPEWAEPAQMCATYALLYNCIHIYNAPYLPAVMEKELWRLVYGSAAARPRSLCWAYSYGNRVEARAFQYSRQRMTANERVEEQVVRGRIEALLASPDLDPVTKRRMLEHEKLELEHVLHPPPVMFQRPPRTMHREFARGRRSFEAQYHDAYLCGMHSVNNVANSVLLSPPDLMQAIELLRPLDTPFASSEELALALLREGVFTLPIKLTDVGDLNPLDPDERFPKRKFCLELIEKAGGLIVFQPSPPPALGHFVALVHDPPAEGASLLDEENEYEWCVYSISRIVAHGATAADALDDYIFSILAADTADQRLVDEANRLTDREKRRLCVLNEATISPLQFIGLLPISLRAIHDDATRARQFSELPQEEVEWLYILRSIVRRSLGEMRVGETEDADGARDISMPPPIAPGCFDTICQYIACSVARADQEGEEKESDSASPSATATNGVFDGMDAVNVASLISVRFTTDLTINRAVEAIADSLRKRSTNGKAILAILVELRSYMRELPALGLLFTMRDNFGKFCKMISNRRWLRQFAVTVCATRLIETLRRAPTIDNTLRRLLILFCFVAYANLQGSGVKISSMPAFEYLFTHLVSVSAEELVHYLPLECAPPGLTRKKLGLFLLSHSYNATLWLMHACDMARLPADLLVNLEMFSVTDNDPALDDLSDAYDERAVFVALLRQTLFMMPGEQNDFGFIERAMPAQRPSDATHEAIAVHCNRRGQEFLAAMTDRDLAIYYTDRLAFDWRFIEDAEAASKTEHIHFADDMNPRFVMRMFEWGVPEVIRQTFGVFITNADSRTPIVNNIDRLPLPSVPGNWLHARPRCTPDVWLSTAPLRVLPTISEADRESIHYGNSRTTERANIVLLDEDDPSDTTSPVKRPRMISAYHRSILAVSGGREE